MMRSSLLSGVLSMFMVSMAAAQNVTTSARFFLKLTSDNETLDGQYLGACHAGAAIEGLCLGGKEPPSSSNAGSFYLNQTDYGSGLSDTGVLAWDMPFTGPDGPSTLSEPLMFQLGPLGSNVVVPLFQPGYATTTSLGFDDEDKLYLQSVDDAKLVSGQYPATSSAVNLYSWYACWAQTGGYYYNVLAWVTSGTPHNPTCESVAVLREMIDKEAAGAKL